jgi:hypothetical protein
MTTAFLITLASVAAIAATGMLPQYLPPILGQTEAAKELAKEIVAAKENLVMWSTMPLAGALLASAMAFVLNRKTEQIRLVMGRAIGAGVVGVVVPRVGTYFHPWLKEMALDPIVLFGVGFAFGLCGYVLAAVFVDKMFKKAPEFAERAVEDLAERGRGG